MSQDTKAPAQTTEGFWGSAPLSTVSSPVTYTASTTVAAPISAAESTMDTVVDSQSTLVSTSAKRDKVEQNEDNRGILNAEMLGPSEACMAGLSHLAQATSHQIATTLDDVEPGSLCAPGSPIKLGRKYGADSLVMDAFPMAPTRVAVALAVSFNAYRGVMGLRHLKPGGGLDKAWAVLSDVRAARSLARSTFRHGKVEEGVTLGLATQDGLLVGTSNAPADLSPEGYELLKVTKPLRACLLQAMPKLELALCEPECVSGATLPIEGATALSVAGWGEFSKWLDVLYQAAATTLMRLLEQEGPGLAVPLTQDGTRSR